MIDAELTRQRWSARKVMLEELKEYLQPPTLEDVEPEQFSNKEFAPEFLAPFIRD